jgi:hypothetical protein
VKRNWLVAGIALVLIVVIALGAFALRSHLSGTSDEELTRIARAVPVPSGVTFVPPEDHLIVSNGLAAHHREVSRYYRTDLPCSQLLPLWEDALRQAHRQFIDDSDPSTNTLRLRLTDSPAHVRLAVFLGGFENDTSACTKPGINAVGSTYNF